MGTPGIKMGIAISQLLVALVFCPLVNDKELL